jgi:hypothetical protein
MASLVFSFRLNQQSVVVTATRKKCLFEDEIEQSLLDELTASD